jgi:hypothetical protein
VQHSDRKILKQRRSVTRPRQCLQTAEARRREDGRGGRRRRISWSMSSWSGRDSGSAGDLPRRVIPMPFPLAWIWGWRRRRGIPANSSLVPIWGWRRRLRRWVISSPPRPRGQWKENEPRVGFVRWWMTALTETEEPMRISSHHGVQPQSV